jgi:hypothetical protein
MIGAEGCKCVLLGREGFVEGKAREDDVVLRRGVVGTQICMLAVGGGEEFLDGL